MTHIKSFYKDQSFIEQKELQMLYSDLPNSSPFFYTCKFQYMQKVVGPRFLLVLMANIHKTEVLFNAEKNNFRIFQQRGKTQVLSNSSD